MKRYSKNSKRISNNNNQVDILSFLQSEPSDRVKILAGIKAKEIADYQSLFYLPDYPWVMMHKSGNYSEVMPQIFKEQFEKAASITPKMLEEYSANFILQFGANMVINLREKWGFPTLGCMYMTPGLSKNFFKTPPPTDCFVLYLISEKDYKEGDKVGEWESKYMPDNIKPAWTVVDLQYDGNAAIIANKEYGVSLKIKKWFRVRDFGKVFNVWHYAPYQSPYQIIQTNKIMG